MSACREAQRRWRRLPAHALFSPSCRCRLPTRRSRLRQIFVVTGKFLRTRKVKRKKSLRSSAGGAFGSPRSAQGDVQRRRRQIVLSRRVKALISQPFRLFRMPGSCRAESPEFDNHDAGLSCYFEGGSRLVRLAANHRCDGRQHKRKSEASCMAAGQGGLPT